MQALVDMIKAWQPHPVVDHFTVALIVVGVLIDLVASIIPSRIWIRYMALSLMVLGAAAAWGSNITGGWEADRVWDNVTGPAKDVLKTHAQVGDILPWVFLGLAVWRLGVQFLGFLMGTRPIYLLVAVIAMGAVLYQGYKGGELVYDYGVGTALMATPAPQQTPASPPAEASPIPTVSVPTPTPTPTAAPGSSSASPFGVPSPGNGTSPTAPANPPTGGEASPGASSSATPVPKNL
jgi:uncharacterized membrane protein